MLVARSRIKLSEMVDSEMYAIIFQLEYTIVEPVSAQSAKEVYLHLPIALTENLWMMISTSRKQVF